MLLRGLIFDLDDTLTNSAGLSIAAYQHAFAQILGQVPSPDEIRRHFGPSEEGVMQSIAPERWRECAAAYHAYERLHLDGVRAYAGIPELLAGLQARGLPLSIVTGRGPVNLGPILAQARLEGIFEPVLCGDLQTRGKVNAIRQVVARWGLATEEAAYLGDSASDMRAAREAGVQPLWARWAGEKKDGESAVERFETVSQFAVWIESRIA